MEKLQAPFTPCVCSLASTSLFTTTFPQCLEQLSNRLNLFGQDLDVGWLEEYVSNIENNYKFEEELYNEEVCDTTQLSNHLLPSLEDKIPFLQMLQPTIPFINPQQSLNPKMIYDRPVNPTMQEPPNYFQLLLRLQHHQNNNNFPCELESCTTNINNNNDMIMDQHTPIKCEALENKGSQPRVEGAPRERKKRKRPTKISKNKEEVETQRMTHIAVERNRRRQMNEHLNALRALMPPSYVQRGDQASIIGGAIDFVKEMEQLLQSLQAQKRMRHHQPEEILDVSTTSSTSSSSNMLNNMFITSPTSPFQFRNFSPNEEGIENPNEISRNNNNEEFSAENRSALADIKVIVIQNHVNLKIHCQRRPGQLLKVILAFEELRLTILHLNITSLDTLVYYSFNLKIEEDCNLGSADEVVRAVHHIFTLINLS